MGRYSEYSGGLISWGHKNMIVSAKGPKIKESQKYEQAGYSSGVQPGNPGYSGRGIQGYVLRVFRPLILGFSVGNLGGTSPRNHI